MIDLDKPIRAMEPVAQRLICAVRDMDPREAHVTFTGLDAQDLQALAVVLAALVPPDRPLGELAGWVPQMDDMPDVYLRWCHAQHGRGVHGAPVCEGNRAYERRKARRRVAA